MLRIIAFLCLVILQCNAVEISNGRFEATVLVKKPIDTSLMVGKVDDWFFSGAGVSNDQAKVGEDVHQVNQFAFVNPKGHLSQDIELETEKTYMISWVDASLDSSSYSVSITQLNNGVPSEFQTINTVFSISEEQHWSSRVVFVTPLRDANYQLTFKSFSGATFYIDKVDIKEVICESRDSISDGKFQKTTPSAIWEYSNNARIIPSPDTVPRAQIESGAYFAFCVPLFVGRYSFTVDLRRAGSSVHSGLGLSVSAAERSLSLVVNSRLDSKAVDSFKTQTYTFEVDTEGIYSFAFMSQYYGDTTTYEIADLALSARLGSDLTGGLPFYTGITTAPEFNNAQFEDYDVSGDQTITSPDSEADAIWIFDGNSGLSRTTSRLPPYQQGFNGQFAFVNNAGTLGQSVHINSNTDVVISFLTVVDPNTIPNPADDFSFNVMITTDALHPSGFVSSYPVYYSTDHKATQYVRRSFVFFTSLTSGFYHFTITSASTSTLLFDDFQIETVICDKARPYLFDFTAQGGLPGPNWELFGATVVPGIQITAGQAAGQCIVATEAADVNYEFSIKVQTSASSSVGDNTPLTIGIDSVFGGKAVISTYEGITTGDVYKTSSDTTNVVIQLKKWNHYDTNYPLLQAIVSAGFNEAPPPTPSKYFIYAYVDAKEGTNSYPVDKVYEIDSINVIERVTNTLEVNHQPYGGHIYIPQGIIGIADVFVNDTRSFDRTPSYTAHSNDPTFFKTAPTFDQTTNTVSFVFSPYADGPVTISIVNNNDNTVAHLDLFLCASRKDHPVEGTTLAICVRTKSQPRDVFVRRDIAYDPTRTMAEFQPGDWWKNKVLDCSCNLVDMPSKQPKYIWPA